jgi:hypothetical protein
MKSKPPIPEQPLFSLTGAPTMSTAIHKRLGRYAGAARDLDDLPNRGDRSKLPIADRRTGLPTSHKSTCQATLADAASRKEQP